MTRKQKYAVGLVLLVVVYAGNEYLQYRMRHEEILTSPVLKDDEKQKIIIDTNKKKVTLVRRDKDKQIVDVKEGARKIVVVEDKDGNINVTAITKGFCFEPGLTLYYSDRARLGLDAQVAYYKQWGVLLGAGVNMGDEPRTVRLHVGVNYALPLNFLENTSVFAGIDHRKDATVGLRIKF